MRDVAILGIGVLLGYLLLKRNVINTEPTIKVGDKGKDIEGMQKMFEKLANLKFNEYGQYDSDTLAAVQYLMAGTNALKNSEEGHLDTSMVQDLSTIYNNSLKS